MKGLLAAVLLLGLLALVAAQSPASPDAPVTVPSASEVHARVGNVKAGLKKPIIFSPPAAAGTPDADAPLVGSLPKRLRHKLKKAVVTTHIFGGKVEFKKSRTRHGCACRQQIKERHRYDVQFRHEEPKLPRKKCRCHKRRAHHHKRKKHSRYPTHVSQLPPVVAAIVPNQHDRLRARRRARKALKKCLKRRRQGLGPIKEKIAPAYYPARRDRRAERRARHAHKKACLKKHHRKHRKPTVTPEFYPLRQKELMRLRREQRMAAYRAEHGMAPTEQIVEVTSAPEAAAAPAAPLTPPVNKETTAL